MFSSSASNTSSPKRQKSKTPSQKSIDDQKYLFELLSKNNLVFVKGKISIRSKTRCNRKKFTPEEDEKLIKLASTHNRWEDIAKEMPGRNGRQCRDRYKNYLKPGYFNGQWTPEEDIILQKKFNEYGPQWSMIKQFFNNRSSNSLKNRWNYYISKHINEDHSSPQIEQIIEKPEDNEEDDHKDDEFLAFYDQNDDMWDFGFNDINLFD